MTIIKVEHLTKEFKKIKRREGRFAVLHDLIHREYLTKKAVDNINFVVNQGEILGYIGPNGAGKSTTIKMLSGILVPTKGHIEVYGLVPHKKRREYSRHIGVVFGQRTQLWWDIPVIETFKLFKDMYRIPTTKFNRNLELFNEVLDIGSFIDTPVRQLSLGQRMRADLCAALLHDPEILFLDEPTIGLDVVVKEKIRDFIKNINIEFRTTVILTTHDMPDIEKLCSRVMVIDDGKIMYDGSVKELKNYYGKQEQMTVEVESVPAKTINISMVNELLVEGSQIHVKYDPTKINSTQILRVLMDKVEIKDFLVKKSDIDEVTRNIYNSSSKEVK